MKYTNSYQVSLTCDPFFTESGGEFKFTMLQMYEELNGTIAYGTLKMIHNGSPEALTKTETVFKATLVLTDENNGGLTYTIPISIVSRYFLKNFFVIKFICVGDKNFAFDKHIMNYEMPIKDLIELLYPGKTDIRIQSDVVDPPKYMQINETDHELCKRLCFSYKHECIFAFGWEGLMLKDTFGEFDHNGNNEKPSPKLWIRAGGDLEQLDMNRWDYHHSRYHLPYNCWEPDYSKWEPINFRMYKRCEGIGRVGTDYLPLYENYRYNRLYHDSNYFQTIQIKDFTMPRYKIGDVLDYKRENRIAQRLELNDVSEDKDSIFLVKSNELFFATEECDEVDSSGYKFSWTTTLAGIEENGNLKLGSEEDPTD